MQEQGDIEMTNEKSDVSAQEKYIQSMYKLDLFNARVSRYLSKYTEENLIFTHRNIPCEDGFLRFLDIHNKEQLVFTGKICVIGVYCVATLVDNEEDNVVSWSFPWEDKLWLAKHAENKLPNSEMQKKIMDLRSTDEPIFSRGYFEFNEVFLTHYIMSAVLYHIEDTDILSLPVESKLHEGRNLQIMQAFLMEDVEFVDDSDIDPNETLRECESDVEMETDEAEPELKLAKSDEETVVDEDETVSDGDEDEERETVESVYSEVGEMVERECQD